MTTAMRSAAIAVPTDQLMDAQTAAAAAGGRFALVGGMPFGPIMGLDPLPAEPDADDRLADAARRVELLVGYTRNDGAPFVAMDPRVVRMRRFGPLGSAFERFTAAAMTRKVFGRPARRLAESWRGYGGRAATYRVDWSPPGAPLGACHCIELPLLFGAQVWADAPMLGAGPVDHRLAEVMLRTWSGFAHHGVSGLDSTALRFG